MKDGLKWKCVCNITWIWVKRRIEWLISKENRKRKEPKILFIDSSKVGEDGVTPNQDPRGLGIGVPLARKGAVFKNSGKIFKAIGWTWDWFPCLGGMHGKP